MARVYEGKLGLVNGRLAVGLSAGSAPGRVGHPRARAELEAVRRVHARFPPSLFTCCSSALRSQVHPLAPEPARRLPRRLRSKAAASFVTNTNWQYMAASTRCRTCSQMAGLAVQNFVSAAVGMAVWRQSFEDSPAETSGIGNFWRDLYRSLGVHPAP